jgi:hypothetical protein
LAAPDVGESAIPAVENAAIPQYKASPYDLICAPSIFRSAKYIPAENINHSTINSFTILVKGVWAEISLINRLDGLCGIILLIIYTIPEEVTSTNILTTLPLLSYKSDYDRTPVAILC